MSSIEDLYQEIILDHNKRPRNFGPLQGSTHQADGLNPLCGDEITVRIRLENAGIAGVHFEGQGCAISRASASMMTEAVLGKTLAESRRIAEQVIQALLPKGEALTLNEHGEVAALLGVRDFPARIKCATLAWHAFLCALDGGESVSTEVENH